jgi:hypothetical protein
MSTNVDQEPARPIEYSSAFCEQTITHARTGASPDDFAAQIGVAPSVLREWSNVHPEFKWALDLALTARVATLEDRLRNLLYTTTAEADAEGERILTLLAALCPEDWDENREVRVVWGTP